MIDPGGNSVLRRQSCGLCRGCHTAKPDPNQRDILNSIAKYPYDLCSVRHGIGKSAVESWAAIWYLSTRPFPKIPCTAPTQHQLWDILWAEIAKWLRSNPVLSNDLIWTREKVYMRGYPEEWFAVGPDRQQAGCPTRLPR